MINTLEEQVDVLNKNITIIQKKKGFKYGIDAVLLSHFVSKKGYQNVLDMGSGSGIISLLLHSRKICENIIGIDIQDSYVDMANRSVKMNSIDNVKFISGDFCHLKSFFRAESFDSVVSNPPYFLKNKMLSGHEDKRVARFEIAMSMDELFKNASYVLKNRGDFYLVHRPYRLNDIINTLTKYSLEPKEMRFVHPKKGEASNLVLIKAIKNANRELKVLAPLYVYDEHGYTEEIHRIYNETNIER